MERHDIELLRAMMQEVVAPINDNIQELKIDMKELKTDVTEIKADVDELKTEVTELRTDVEDLKTEVTELRTDVDELKTEVTELRTDVDELKTEVTELRTDVDELKTEVTELRTDVNELKTDVDELKTDVVELRKMDSLILDEAVHIHDVTNERMNLLHDSIQELKHSYHLLNLERGNMDLVLKLLDKSEQNISELTRRMDKLENRIA